MRIFTLMAAAAFAFVSATAQAGEGRSLSLNGVDQKLPGALGKAAVPDELWLIALYTPQGENFYSVVGADMKRAQIELVITSPDQTVEEAGVDAPEGSEDVIVVNAPVSEGIALIRAPLAGPSRTNYAERALKATTCGPYVRPAPRPAVEPTPSPDASEVPEAPL